MHQETKPLTAIDESSIIKRLPPILLDIAEVAGVEAALNLAMYCGGRRLRIPKRVQGSYLAEVLDEAAAQKIIQAMCYMHFEVPQAKAACALWMRHNGSSVEDIAVALKATRRSVQNWIGVR